MAFEPTDAQRAAINARGNILVSAAAGSGKTAVLVERVIKMLTDESNPVNADRLLIVTFTNAADIAAGGVCCLSVCEGSGVVIRSGWTRSAAPTPIT